MGQIMVAIITEWRYGGYTEWESDNIISKMFRNEIRKQRDFGW